MSDNQYCLVGKNSSVETKARSVRLVSLLKCWFKLHRKQTKRSLEQANYASITFGSEYFHWTSKNVRQNIELCPTMKSALQQTQ